MMFFVVPEMNDPQNPRPRGSNFTSGHRQQYHNHRITVLPSFKPNKGFELEPTTLKTLGPGAPASPLASTSSTRTTGLRPGLLRRRRRSSPPPPAQTATQANRRLMGMRSRGRCCL